MLCSLTSSLHSRKKCWYVVKKQHCRDQGKVSGGKGTDVHTGGIAAPSSHSFFPVCEHKFSLKGLLNVSLVVCVTLFLSGLLPLNGNK